MRMTGVQVVDDLFRCVPGSVDFVVNAGQAIVDVDAEFVEQLAVLCEGVLVEDLDRMAEDDRVRDLHHRRLDVQREHHAGLVGILHLLFVEIAQRLLAHEHAVDDFACSSATFSLSTIVLPLLVTRSMDTVQALSRVMDFSPE